MSGHDNTTVAAVMSATVHTIAGAATVDEAIGMMRHHGVSSLVVERRDATDEFGMVVVSDIARKVIGEDRNPERVNVYEIMSKPVIELPANMLLRYAVRMLARFELSRALVVDANREVLGIVTLRDMVLRHPGDE